MLYGNLKYLGDTSAYPKIIYKTLEYLRSKDFNNIEPGKYEIEGKDIYFSVIDTMTDVIEKKKAESHDEFIDIQISPNGGELMGFAINDGDNEIIENKLIEKDVLKYSVVKNEKYIKMNSNDFFVFYPWDIHRPACTDGKPCNIRKVIVKIKMELLDKI